MNPKSVTPLLVILSLLTTSTLCQANSFFIKTDLYQGLNKHLSLTAESSLGQEKTASLTLLSNQTNIDDQTITGQGAEISYTVYQVPFSGYFYAIGLNGQFKTIQTTTQKDHLLTFTPYYESGYAFKTKTIQLTLSLRTSYIIGIYQNTQTKTPSLKLTPKFQLALPL